MAEETYSFGDVQVTLKQLGRVKRVFELSQGTEPGAMFPLGFLVPKDTGGWSAFSGPGTFLPELAPAAEVNLFRDLRLAALALVVIKYKYKPKVPFALSKENGGDWEVRNGAVIDRRSKCQVW